MGLELGRRFVTGGDKRRMFFFNRNECILQLFQHVLFDRQSSHGLSDTPLRRFNSSRCGDFTLFILLKSYGEIIQICLEFRKCGFFR